MTKVKMDPNDLGVLVWLAIHKGISSHAYFSDQAIAMARKYWKEIDPYYHRKIVCDVQVAIAVDSASIGEANRDDEGRPVKGRKLSDKDKWQKFVEEFEPPKSEHTIDYHCHKCKARGVKLWRPVHGGEIGGRGLKCAACLAPGETVSGDGRLMEVGLDILTDQVKGWLPACPVGDTYWGYSSVPSADVRWWKSLPTYQSKVEP